MGFGPRATPWDEGSPPLDAAGAATTELLARFRCERAYPETRTPPRPTNLLPENTGPMATPTVPLDEPPIGGGTW